MIRKRKLALVTAIASALGVGMMQTAAAVVDLDASATSPAPSHWAEEIDIDDTNNVLRSGSDTKLDATVEVEVIIPDAVERYVRFDLSGGATFDYATLPTSAVADGTVSYVGGTSGETFLIYKIVATSEIPANAALSLGFASGNANDGIGVKDSATDINMTFSLYESIGGAGTGGSQSRLNGAGEGLTAPYIAFVPSSALVSSAQQAETADVGAGFLQFTGNDTTTALIGKVDFAAVAAMPFANDASSSSLITLAALFSDVTMTITPSTGSFIFLEDNPVGSGTYTSATGKIFLSTDGNCVAGTSASAVTETAATFDVISGSANEFVCVRANGVTPIPVGVFDAEITATAKSGFVAPTFVKQTSIGSIERNGTQLDTPYLTGATGYISRIFLSNTGTVDADYTVQLLTDDGQTVTPGGIASGTIKAGTNAFIRVMENSSVVPTVPGLISAFSGGPRGSARFTIGGSPRDIQGIFQTVNLNSGDVQSILMTQPHGSQN